MGRRSRLGKRQFGIAGLLVLITIVSVRLAIYSYQARPRTILKVPAGMLSPASVEQLRREVSATPGVESLQYKEGILRVRIIRPQRSQAVLKVLQNHGIDVTRFEASSNASMMRLEREARKPDRSSPPE